MSELDLSKLIIKCAECGKETAKIQPTQRFCSDLCRGRHYHNKKKRQKEANMPKKRDLFAA